MSLSCLWLVSDGYPCTDRLHATCARQVTGAGSKHTNGAVKTFNMCREKGGDSATNPHLLMFPPKSLMSWVLGDDMRKAATRAPLLGTRMVQLNVAEAHC